MVREEKFGAAFILIFLKPPFSSWAVYICTRHKVDIDEMHDHNKDGIYTPP